MQRFMCKQKLVVYVHVFTNNWINFSIFVKYDD